MDIKINSTITSLEVAEMMGRTHKKVLESIRLYISQMEEVERRRGTGTEKGWLRYFNESAYTAGNGQEQPCYNVTKIGCEFLAHKLKGVKGTEFTMRYIDRFHEMEEEIKVPKLPDNPMEMLEIHYQALKQVDKKVGTLEERFNKFEQELPMLPDDADEVRDFLNKRVVNLLGGKDSNAYKDKSLSKKVFSDAYRVLKYNFNVSRYKAIKRSQKSQALQVIEEYKPPLFLMEQIEYSNAQQKLDI